MEEMSGDPENVPVLARNGETAYKKEVGPH